MNDKQSERMRMDIKQITSPMESTIITKHYCFSFITFLIGELRPEVQKILKDSDKYEEVKSELQVLRLNRVLGMCPFPDECDEYDFCEKEACNKTRISLNKKIEEENDYE